MRWNARVHRLDLGLYSHPKELEGEGGGGGGGRVRTHVNSQGKSPLPDKFSPEGDRTFNSKGKSPLPDKFSPEEDRTHDAVLCGTEGPTHYQRAIPAPCHSILTPSDPVLALTPLRQAPGRVATMFNPVWTHLPQITQLCGLCCDEETSTIFVDCACFLPITALTMRFLLLPGEMK